MRYLAIDPGQKRTGLAVGDDTTALAHPLEVIQSRDPETVLQKIAKAIDCYGPDQLILGLPLNMDGTKGPAAESARKLAARLESRFALPVHLMDERLTSFAAEQKLKQLGTKSPKTHPDAVAAAMILQDFLEQKGT